MGPGPGTASRDIDGPEQALRFGVEPAVPPDVARAVMCALARTVARFHATA